MSYVRAKLSSEGKYTVSDLAILIPRWIAGYERWGGSGRPTNALLGFSKA